MGIDKIRFLWLISINNHVESRYVSFIFCVQIGLKFHRESVMIFACFKALGIGPKPLYIWNVG